MTAIEGAQWALEILLGRRPAGGPYRVTITGDACHKMDKEFRVSYRVEELRDESWYPYPVWDLFVEGDVSLTEWRHLLAEEVANDGGTDNANIHCSR